jgi:hypothetical protein
MNDATYILTCPPDRSKYEQAALCSICLRKAVESYRDGKPFPSTRVTSGNARQAEMQTETAENGEISDETGAMIDDLLDAETDD